MESKEFSDKTVLSNIVWSQNQDIQQITIFEFDKHDKRSSKSHFDYQFICTAQKLYYAQEYIMSYIDIVENIQNH